MGFNRNTLLVNFAQTQYPPQFFKLSGCLKLLRTVLEIGLDRSLFY